MFNGASSPIFSCFFLFWDEIPIFLLSLSQQFPCITICGLSEDLHFAGWDDI
jgi:hypothetical protein